MCCRALICCNLVSTSSSFSCQVFMLTGSHLFHSQSEQSVCSYISSGFSTFPAFAPLSLWALLAPSSYRESGSAMKQDLCPFCIQPVYITAALAYTTYGRYSSAAYNFRCCCQHNCCPCTISAHTPTVLLAIIEHVKRLIDNFEQVFVSPQVAAIVHRLLASSLSFYQRMYICTLRKSQVSEALHVAQFSYPTSVALLPLSH